MGRPKINDGLSNAQRHYQKHRERIIAKNVDRRKRYYLGDPEKHHKWSRKGRLRREYGITIEIYEEMFAEQNGLCGICSSPPTTVRLDTDHNHDTGEVRGLLCRKCNMAIGLLHDNPVFAHNMELWLLKKGR